MAQEHGSRRADSGRGGAPSAPADAAAPPPPLDDRRKRRIRRANMIGYGVLVAPGVAFLGLALDDALASSRWVVFAGLAALISVSLFLVPLFGHYRCAGCRRYFGKQRSGLAGRNTVYRCSECGHTSELAEWCSLREILTSAGPSARR